MTTGMARLSRVLTFPVDLIVSAFVTLYQTLGFLIFFFPLYLIAYFSRHREATFQRLNAYYYRGFFGLINALVPRLDFHVSDRIAKIHSSVVVCNQRSYLDSILLTALFNKQRTIVKGTLFWIPFMGWIFKTSGFIPTTGGGLSRQASLRLNTTRDFLDSGGNLVVFPEGTRSKDGRLGTFKKGAFSIARKCHAPIEILQIENTQVLFPRGHMLLNTCTKNTIKVVSLGTLEPDIHGAMSIPEVTQRVRQVYLEAGEQDGSQ